MRTVLQRANGAAVSVDGKVVAAFDGPGLVALVAAHKDDGEGDVDKTAGKIANLRIMEGEKSVLELGLPVLVISQFTLYGRTKKGTRPSWSDAAQASVAEPMVDSLVAKIASMGLPVYTGVFGAMMQVSLTNDGPVTLIIDTRD